MHAEKTNVIKVSVEKAKSEDLPIVIQIFKQHSDLFKQYGIRMGVNCDNTYVARNESLGVVGAVMTKKDFPKYPGFGQPQAELKTAGVESSLQGRGIGRQMISQVIEELKKEGFHKITVQFDSKKANVWHLFESMGFKGEKNDWVLMKLNV